MSSYDPTSVQDMRPRTWLENFVAARTKSHEQVRAEIIAECQFQGDAAKANRELLGKKRRNENANWIWIGGKIGARDAYIEGELAAKRKAEAAAQ